MIQRSRNTVCWTLVVGCNAEPIFFGFTICSVYRFLPLQNICDATISLLVVLLWVRCVCFSHQRKLIACRGPQAVRPIRPGIPGCQRAERSPRHGFRSPEQFRAEDRWKTSKITLCLAFSLAHSSVSTGVFPIKCAVKVVPFRRIHIWKNIRWYRIWWVRGIGIW